MSSANEGKLRQNDLPRTRQHQALDDHSSVSTIEEGISFLDVWGILVRHRPLILSVIVICTLASIVFALFMTPLYRAEIQVAPVSQKDSNSRFAAQLGELGGLAALSGINMEQGGKKNESIATLKSRKFTEQFIQDEKLLPVLFHDRWDAENQRWIEAGFKAGPTKEDAWELFNENIRKVSEDKTNGMVVLSIEWEDPVEASRWANELVLRVNEMLRRKAAEESETAIGYLQEQLRKTSVVELQQVINHLIESEMKEVILANITREYAFRVIDPAVVPEKPFKPIMALMAAFGVVFGAILGIIVAVIISSVRARQDKDICQPN